MTSVSPNASQEIEILDDKYLDDQYLKMLCKLEPLTKDEIEYLFKETVLLIQKDIRIHGIMIQEAEDIDAPVAQCGFLYDQDSHQMNHLITVNYRGMRDFPIPRILLVACHECGHLFFYEPKAQELEEGKISLEEYIQLVRRKEDNWYSQKSEQEADRFGFIRSKNIYQRAAHDTDDLSLKGFFWGCYDLLLYNEMLEMKKHEISQEELVK